MNLLILLADATSAPAPVDRPWYASPQQFIFPLMIGLIVLMFLTSSKTKRAEQKKRDEMLQNLNRGARVVTIGGILGTVVDARENEVVLKVDEGSNTKIKFTRDAINRVLTDEDTATK